MKITRETLKQMIAEEVAKMDPQNEGFGDIMKGMGKYYGAKIGMDTDKPGVEFAAKINATLSQVGFSPQETGDSVSQYSRNAIYNLVKMGEKAAQKLYADEGKREQLIQVAQKVQAELKNWANSSEGAKQAEQFGSGTYSPKGSKRMRITKSRLIQIIKEEVAKARLGEDLTPAEKAEYEETLAGVEEFTDDIPSATKKRIEKHKIPLSAIATELGKEQGQDKAEIMAAIADELGVDPDELMDLAKQIASGTEV